MNETNTNPISPNPQVYSSSSTNVYKSDSSEGANQFFQTPAIKETMDLFNLSKLPELFLPATLTEVIKDPKNAKSIEDYQAIFQTSSLADKDFQAIMQNFSMDQVTKKGYFKPIEAFSDWNAYLQEQTRLEKDASEWVHSIKQFNQQKTASSTPIPGSSHPAPVEEEGESPYVNVEGDTSVPGGITNASPPPTMPELDPFTSINMILDLYISLMTRYQDLAMTYSVMLDTQTQIQEELLDLQSEALQPISITIFPEDMQDDDEIVDMVDNYNNVILPSLQEENRAKRDAAQDRAEALNNQISSFINAASSLSDSYSTILTQLTSMTSAVVR